MNNEQRRTLAFAHEDQAPVSKTSNSIIALEELEDAQSLLDDIVSAYPAVGTVEDAAALLGVPVSSMRAMCRRGDINAIKVGRLWRIPRTEIISFIQRGGSQW